VAAISVAALILTAAATVYPAVRAARTAPAEALRYE
jgi:lipoprotein-releasing system permease protein